MEQAFVLALVGLTSLAAFLLGARGLGLSWNGLGAAVGRMLECVGLALVFFVTNLAAGMTVVLLGRLVTRGFLPLYLANDVSLVALSLLQALTFQWWRERGGLRGF
ncbi:MAG TPA: hypothetical protein VLH58_03910 [Candidatus Methylomirabilis sp.]|nr:hypothetical protein [Candidatus Methylomirabilis sp.]HSC70471.1 hypothetical protein [Candidatus Methylomirabilis sp.]